MPQKTARSRLPPQVADFIDAFAQTGDYRTAAIDVAVHPRNVEKFYREVMAHPDAREAFDQAIRTRFANAAPLAAALLVKIVRDETGIMFTGEVRFKAAKDILDRSGYTPKALAQQPAEKDMGELSREELLQIVSQGEDELASRAKLVDNVAVSDALDVQVVDIES